MDAGKKLDLLKDLKSEFDDYVDYFDLMECLPDITEAKINSLKENRTRNGLQEISYYVKREGTLMVSISGFRAWVKRSFKADSAY
jgi:hypothetical protein